MIPFSFELRLNLGQILNYVVLLTMFFAWMWLRLKERRSQEEDRGRAGALRLLLRILRRDVQGRAVTLAELKQLFDAPELKEARIAYCGSDFKYRNDAEFEAAIHRLDWEMKIDWVETDKIRARVRRA